MNVEELIQSICQRALSNHQSLPSDQSGPRFILDESREWVSEFLALCPSETLNRKVVRLKRNREGSGWRTILVVQANSKVDRESAIRWAAEVRDVLVDPEMVDIYLFIIGTGLPEALAGQIEADEHFCRKFVQRQNEPIDSLLDRTFLASPLSDTGSVLGEDPLLAALSAVAVDHPSFSEGVRLAWQQQLLSGSRGGDLTNALMETFLITTTTDLA